jgi:hypothetical protein
MSERETVVELPFAADCCPCVEKLRNVLPLTVGIGDGAVQLVSTLRSVVGRHTSQPPGGVWRRQMHPSPHTSPHTHLVFSVQARRLSTSGDGGHIGCGPLMMTALPLSLVINGVSLFNGQNRTSR